MIFLITLLLFDGVWIIASFSVINRNFVAFLKKLFADFFGLFDFVLEQKEV